MTKRQRLGWALALVTLLVALAVPVLPLGRCAFSALGDLQLQTNRLDEWKSFGGAWEIRDGAIHNNSDERGAKLVTGSVGWADYTLTSDIRFDGERGDMGLMIRSNDEDAGVDSYRGYYAGLRTADGTLVVGRSDYGWEEARPVAMPGGVHGSIWYRLTVSAFGCDLFASSENLATHQRVGFRFVESGCVRSGRIGLRSFSTGGSWKSIRVAGIGRDAYEALLRSTPLVEHPEFPKAEADYNRVFSAATAAPAASPLPRRAQKGSNEAHIGDLQNLPRSEATGVHVRGVVTITQPVLYVQDATGGVLVRDAHPPALNVGDAVQVDGLARPTRYSAIIEDAAVSSVWSGATPPPISVTPFQASSGSYEGRLIEVQGRLVDLHHSPNGLDVLDLSEGGEVFRALYLGPLHSLQKNSYLRLRGVCVLDRSYTEERTAFAVMLRSLDDIQVLEGPPWWTPLHVIAVCIGALVLTLLLQVVYFRVQQWKVHTVTQERERLAHEIHDTMAQSFAGVGYQIQGIRSSVMRSQVDESPQIAEQLSVAYQLVRRSHEEASRTIAMLASRAPAVEEELLPELAGIANKIAGDQVRCITRIEGQPKALNLRLANALLHIGQEAITNSLAHSSPTTLQIGLSYSTSQVVLSIADDGQGFAPSELIPGFGILGMQKRASEINAEFRIVSAAGRGTEVSVTADLPSRRFRLRAAAWLNGRRSRKLRQRGEDADHIASRDLQALLYAAGDSVRGRQDE